MLLYQFTMYFHSIIYYGISVWGNSSESGKIFNLHKKIIRIMAVTQPRTSCRILLKQSDSTCSMSVIHSLMTFIIVNNYENFQTNSSIHNNNNNNNNNTRNRLHLHRPNANLSCFQKCTFYAGIKIFSSLPPSVTILKNDKANFKAALRKYLPIPFF
jgi:hypothetical protein